MTAKEYLNGLKGSTDKEKIMAVAYRLRAKIKESNTGRSVWIADRRFFFNKDGSLDKIITH